MALRIKNGKVINMPQPKLTDKQYEAMLNAPIDKKMINRATSRKYNIVYARI